jgi:hypothetical protein
MIIIKIMISIIKIQHSSPRLKKKEWIFPSAKVTVDIDNKN